MRYDHVPLRVLRDLTEWFEENDREASMVEWVQQATPEEVLERYLEWNGIIGYRSLYEIANNLGRERVFQTMHPYHPGPQRIVNESIKVEVSHNVAPEPYSFYVTMTRDGKEQKRQGFFELIDALNFATILCEECGK